MKCNKCGNEYENENFCPVCGYPSEQTVKKRNQAERYASQFGDNFDMDTDEETDRIIDRAKQAQQYDSQFSSDYGKLFKEYEADVQRKTNSLDNAEDNTNVQSNSNENLASYDDEYGVAEDDRVVKTAEKSRKPLIAFLVIILILLLCGIAWFFTESMGINPFITEKPTEESTTAYAPTAAKTEIATLQQATEESATEAITEEQTEAPTEATTEAPTEAITEAPTETPTETITEMPTEAQTAYPTETGDNTYTVDSDGDGYPDNFVDEDNDGYDDNTDIYYGIL